MHNMRPEKALNLASYAQNFVLLACLIDKCTLLMGKQISFWPLVMAKNSFWTAMRFELCISGVDCCTIVPV